MESFKNLGISEPVLRSIHDAKFESPSEIQEKSIPLIIAGKMLLQDLQLVQERRLHLYRYNTEFRKRKGLQALCPCSHKKNLRAGSKGFNEIL